jgi:hypothetical protein
MIREAHMLRTNPRRRRGRPFGPAPTFLDDCVRLDATLLLSKCRGARLVATDAPGDVRHHWTLQWTEDGHAQQRLVELRVTATPQPLGGCRLWWVCGLCRRRCRRLLATDPRAPLGCRVCLRARYAAADYAARHRRRRFIAIVHALGSGRLDVEHDDAELDMLLAPRRRGVRRGRRILMRAARALRQLKTRCDAFSRIFDGGL